MYLKLLIPHEVQGLFNFCNCAGPFPAEVCCCSSVEIVRTLLFKTV